MRYMAPLRYSFGIVSLFLFFCLANLRRGTIAEATIEDRKEYIVYMGALPEREYSPSSHHLKLLQEVVPARYEEKSLIRSYKRSFNGFVAHLTEAEQEKIALNKDVVSIFPSRNLQLLTTESWDFMGFHQTNVDRNLSIESDLIIGVLDTGILPDSPSFRDEGFGPIPEKWKGACHGGDGFSCNKKVIGARYYSFEKSAIDRKGHGTHVASIAAGNNVKNTSFFDIANGTARGGVPAARIAVYQVCTRIGCRDSDVLAAFDDAIADGVDIISISIGPDSAIPIGNDTIAIGSLHAAEKGILTVNSAGNDGAKPGLIASTAPWMLSVAASSTTRKIINKAMLNNGSSIESRTINTYDFDGKFVPIVHGKDLAMKGCDEENAKRCHCLEEKLVTDKVVLCSDFYGFYEGLLKGPVGYLMLQKDTTDEEDDVSVISPSGLYPVAYLNSQQYNQLETYYYSSKSPEANIQKSEAVNDSTAPMVASFSSRGPNPVIPDILKPDITAPGIDILAAFNPILAPSGHPILDGRSVNYTFLSGTSMSCPHVTGAAAYVKSKHPQWSSAAIKSALMTTAWRMNNNNTRNGDAEFSYGAGHLDPLKAVCPGIVYDISPEEYTRLFHSLVNSSSAKMEPKDLNYPSMAAQVKANQLFNVEFPRSLTNVGLPNSSYKATTFINTGSELIKKITVEPDTISFQALNEKKSFTVAVTGELKSDIRMISVSLEWSDGVHTARSPIVIFT